MSMSLFLGAAAPRPELLLLLPPDPLPPSPRPAAICSTQPQPLQTLLLLVAASRTPCKLAFAAVFACNCHAKPPSDAITTRAHTLAVVALMAASTSTERRVTWPGISWTWDDCTCTTSFRHSPATAQQHWVDYQSVSFWFEFQQQDSRKFFCRW